MPDSEYCLSLSYFGVAQESGVPALLYNILPKLADVFMGNDTHWSAQIVDALADGYSTSAKMQALLSQEYHTYNLREILLVFHWFFRVVSSCAGKITLEQQMRRMTSRDRLRSNYVNLIMHFDYHK